MDPKESKFVLTSQVYDKRLVGGGVEETGNSFGTSRS